MTRTLSLIVSVISSLGVINALRASKAYVHAPGKAHNDDCLSRTQSSTVCAGDKAVSVSSWGVEATACRLRLA